MPRIPESAHRIEIPDFKERVGKVRHTYEVDTDHLLMVSSDRVSTFDVVHPTAIPDKGKILTQMAAFWFERIERLGIPHHFVTADTDEIIARYPNLLPHKDQLQDRSMLVNKGDVYPVEAIVRGNITGSGWKDYKKTGEVCGIRLPEGLQESQELDPPIFTPSTKAEVGHDENIPFERAAEIVGKDVASQIRELSILLFSDAREYARIRGIIIADTKVEWANINGELTLVDEVLTPDSSRFWPEDSFELGKTPNSLDKQYVRDYVNKLGWNKEYPAPELPEEVVQLTRRKYVQACEQLTGRKLDI
jgi:phosphoribosylaminoimidazole-succinocarboxamide synthase